MLPKIIEAGSIDRETVRKELGINVEKEIGFDGLEGTVKDFRSWMDFAVNISRQSKEYCLVVWNADSLKADCQNVLLKPLEEKPPEVHYFLIVDSENGLLPTVRSRCQIEKVETGFAVGHYWGGVVKCWKESPGQCIAFAESVKNDEVVAVYCELIEKLQTELEKKVNSQRVEILRLALSGLKVMKDVNVNPRLCLEDFLLQSWMVVKA